MIRKQGLPIPLPTAFVKFPSPALQHRLLSTTTYKKAGGSSEEHIAVWRQCTDETYGCVGRRLHAARSKTLGRRQSAADVNVPLLAVVTHHALFLPVILLHSMSL